MGWCEYINIASSLGRGGGAKYLFCVSANSLILQFYIIRALGEMAKCVERPSPFWIDRGIQTLRFEPWSNRINVYVIGMYRILARHSALLGQ